MLCAFLELKDGKDMSGSTDDNLSICAIDSDNGSDDNHVLTAKQRKQEMLLSFGVDYEPQRERQKKEKKIAEYSLNELFQYVAKGDISQVRKTCRILMECSELIPIDDIINTRSRDKSNEPILLFALDAPENVVEILAQILKLPGLELEVINQESMGITTLAKAIWLSDLREDYRKVVQILINSGASALNGLQKYFADIMAKDSATILPQCKSYNLRETIENFLYYDNVKDHLFAEIAAAKKSNDEKVKRLAELTEARLNTLTELRHIGGHTECSTFTALFRKKHIKGEKIGPLGGAGTASAKIIDEEKETTALMLNVAKLPLNVFTPVMDFLVSPKERYHRYGADKGLETGK